MEILANDSDPDDNLDPDTVEVTNDPTNGTVVIADDKSIDYTPNQDFTGEDTFEYKVCDTEGLCDTATVTITVNEPTPPNTVLPGEFTLSLQEVCTAEDPEHVLTWTASENADSYTLTRDSQTLTITTETNYLDSNVQTGTTYTYTVTAENSDGTTDSNQVTVTTASCVTEPPPAQTQPPQANDDTVNLPQDSFTVIDVLENDTDPDGTLDPSCVQILSGPNNGTAVVDSSNGNVLYTPNEGYNGQDQFTYEVCDNDGLTDSAIVTINVTPPPPEKGSENQPPQAVDDEAETPSGQAIVIDVPLNDIDPDGNLDITCVKITRNPDNGSVEINAQTGAITYTPNDGFAGTDDFEYSICDTEGLTDTATVTVAVAEAPPAQLASTGAGLFDFLANLWDRFLQLLGLR